MTDAVRLLLLTPEFAPTSGGGIVTFYRHLLPRLIERGVQVTALVGSAYHQPGGRWRHEGVEAIGLEEGAYREQLPRFAHLAAAPEVMRHIAASHALLAAAKALGEFDVVEASDWGLLGAAWVLDGDATPLVVQAHGSAGQIAAHDAQPGAIVSESWLREVERRLLDRAAAVHCNAPANREYWSRRLSAPVQYLAPAQPVGAAPPQVREAGYLVLSRVQRWKGPAILAEALAIARTAAPVRWIGRAVGDPQSPGASMLASLRQRYPDQWGARIRHETTLPWSEVQCQLQRAGGEAQAVAAVFDQVARARSGRCDHGTAGGEPFNQREIEHVPLRGHDQRAGDAAALADALRRFEALDERQCLALGEAGRETVREQLDPGRSADGHLAALRAATARPLPAAPDDLLEVLRPRSRQAGTWNFLSQFPARALGREILRRGRERVLGR